MRPFLLFFFLLLFLFLFLLLLFIKIQAVCSIEIISVRLPHKVIHGLETYLPLHLLIHKPLHQKSTFPSYFINLSFNSFNFLHFLPIKNFAPIRFPMLIVLELLFSDSKLICCFEGISVLLDLSGSLLLFPFDHFSHSLLSFLVASHIKENISVVIVRLRWYGFNQLSFVNKTHKQMRTLLPLLILINLAISATYYTCPSGYFFDLQHCQLCAPNCKCTSMNGCDSCAQGYTMYNGQCIQCPQSSGIYGTCSSCCSKTEGTQLSCTDCAVVPNSYTFLYSGRCIVTPGCFEIDAHGFCLECFSGFYEWNNLCYSCDASCATCTDSTNCLTCNSGFYWTITNGGLCTACPSGCATCDSTGTCSSCLSGYYLFQSNCLACPTYCSSCSDGSTCTACSQGILVSNLCVLCTDTTYQGSAGCTSCSASNNFISCSQCADTYFLDSNGLCQLCSSFIAGSIRCTNQNTPTQCLYDYNSTLTQRYYLVGITCIKNTKTCRKIADIYGNCSTCYDGYVVTSGACVACPFTGCKAANSTVVSNVCTCTQCSAGYYLTGTDCVACTTPNCATCPGDVCSSCQIGYFLNTGSCSASTATHCLIASTATLCSICMDSYYLGSDNICYSCQANCLKCTDRYTCTTCDTANGYYLHSSNTCLAIPANCITLTVDYKCKLCAYGYYIYYGYCVPCNVQLGTLNKCQGLCPIDYYIYSLVVNSWESLMTATIGLVMMMVL